MTIFYYKTLIHLECLLEGDTQVILLKIHVHTWEQKREKEIKRWFQKNAETLAHHSITVQVSSTNECV
jgi:hypothetical protein